LRKASIQGELDGIRAHLMDLLQQMARAEEIAEENAEEEVIDAADVIEVEENQETRGDGSRDNGQQRTTTTSPLLELKSVSPSTMSALPSPPLTLDYPQHHSGTLHSRHLSEKTDLDLKRQVLYLQQQVEAQALKFSVSQADSSFLTDVLAEKDQILQECQEMLVELDKRHHRLSTKNTELEHDLVEKDNEIQQLRGELKEALKKGTSQYVEGIVQEQASRKEERHLKQDPPSYDRLMAKLSKLQVELGTSPVRKVATVTKAAVHWKARVGRQETKDVQQKASENGNGTVQGVVDVAVEVEDVEEDIEGDESHVLVL